MEIFQVTQATTSLQPSHFPKSTSCTVSNNLCSSLSQTAKGLHTKAHPDLTSELELRLFSVTTDTPHKQPIFNEQFKDTHQPLLAKRQEQTNTEVLGRPFKGRTSSQRVSQFSSEALSADTTGILHSF